MTANDSSSSATSPLEAGALELDLLARGRLPALPTAYLNGRDRDLLAPVRFLGAGELPQGPAPAIDRRELARALAMANAAYGHPAAAAQAARLADPATRVVVTGQQPGLYGGPLYALSKMAAAVKWAEAIDAAGEPAVAIFWVATEDHDFSEVARAAFLSRDGVRRVDLGADPAPLLPVGMRTFGPNLKKVEQELEGFDLPDRWYRPDARFGEAFCRFMVSVLGERAPLMLDSMLPEVKLIQRPILSRLVERRAAVEAAQSLADAEIERRGYPLQVKPRPGLSPLFMLHDQARRRIEWTGDGYTLRGVAPEGRPENKPRPLDQLRRILTDNPAIISPGVLARPAVQDAILGTTLQVMGPAELSYMAQVAAVYPVLEIEPPWTTLRPQALVLEERHAGYLEELDVCLAELLAVSSSKGAEADLDQLVAAKLGEDLIGPARRRIEQILDDLQGPLAAIDPGLAGPLRKTRGHIGRGLDQLGGKVAGAIARRHQVWRRRLEQVRASCLPGGQAQERLLSVAHFTGRYGAPRRRSALEAGSSEGGQAEHFGGVLLEQLGLDPRRLHVIRVSPAASGLGAAP